MRLMAAVYAAVTVFLALAVLGGMFVLALVALVLYLADVAWRAY